MLIDDIPFPTDTARLAFQADMERAQFDPEVAERIIRVMHKPSQFVGRVTTIDEALEHWKMHAQWEALHGTTTDDEKPTAVEKMVFKDNVETAREAWKKARADRAIAKKNWDDWYEQAVETARAQREQAMANWDEHVRKAHSNFTTVRTGKRG